MTLTFSREKYGALLADTQPQLITTEEENDRALSIVEALLAKEDLSIEEDRILDLLVELIEKFEKGNYSLGETAPLSILLHLIEAKDLRQADLVGIIGSRGVVSEVFNGKRQISRSQAIALGAFFRVDPSLFIDFGNSV
jgi:HTH-type transcriptional regulator / antitoxin HigA